MNTLPVPSEILGAAGPDLIGDVDAFMASYDAGEQSYYWAILVETATTNLDEIVREDVAYSRAVSRRTSD